MPRQAGEGKAAIAVRVSENAKVGRVSVTTASLESCGDCPLKDNGCYGQNGHIGMVVRRMDRYVQENGLDELAIAQAEAEGIDGLWSGLPLRLHVAGDCRTDETAQIVSAAAERFMDRNQKPAWTYTHQWRGVARESWGKVSVLASCETVQDVTDARARGYAPALVVESFQNGRKPWRLDNGLTAIPCPEQTGASPACTACRLCWNDEGLKARNQVICFEVHGSGKKKAITALKVLNG